MMSFDEDFKVPDLEAELAEIRAKQVRAQENLAKVRGRGTAHNGHIVFEVDAGGKFLDVKLNPQAGDLRIEDLEREVKAAARAAAADAAVKAQEALSELTADPRIAQAMEDMKSFSAIGPQVSKKQPPSAQAYEEEDEPPQSWLRPAY